jgi:hypothetical protein
LDSDAITHAIFNLKFSLYQDSNEWERPLVIVDSVNEVGFTGITTDENQWYTLHEIQCLAVIHPDVELEVYMGYIWRTTESDDFVELKALYSNLKSLRKKYRMSKESGEAMQNTIKLIGNSGYGSQSLKIKAFGPSALSCYTMLF